MINKRIAVFTVVEDASLVAWLALVRAGRKALGVLVLPVGFFVEHVLAYNVKRGAPLLALDVPKGRILVNAVVETGVWVVWLALWALSPVGASVLLYPALVAEHSLTDNIFHGRPLFTNLVNPRVLGFSAVEWVGATAWLSLVGAGLGVLGVAVLVVAQQIEHELAIKLGQTK